jgi:hypothetical protein
MKHYTTLSKHPQGKKYHKSDSFAHCLRALLQSDNIHHEHFRDRTEQDDILDICAYIKELVSSFPEKDLSYFFDNEIIQLMAAREFDSLTSLLETLQSPFNHNQLSHHILCPIMCLKYNLWISVWEDEVILSKKSRNTYFYWFDPTKARVDCKVFHGQYIHLTYQSHILYVRCSKQSNRCGYWEQEELNPFTRSQNLYSYSDNLLCRYSYLDDPLKSKVIDLFKNCCNMNIIPEESPYSRTQYHGNRINPTLVPIVFANPNEKGLLVIFPFNEKENMYDVCIIHPDVPTNVLDQKIEFFKSKLDDETLAPQFSIDRISINLLHDFGLSFLMMLLIFIASTSRNVQQLQSLIHNMRSEIDIVNKSKQWLSNWLSDSFYNPKSTLIIPQWLQQIIGYEASSYVSEQMQESIAKNEQSSGTNIQSHGIGVIHDTSTTRKRKCKTSSREQQIFYSTTTNIQSVGVGVIHDTNTTKKRKLSSDIVNSSISQVESFLDCSAKYMTRPYVEFLHGVVYMAKLERKYYEEKKKKKKKMKKLHKQSFDVASYDKKSISAMNFLDINGQNWIGDEVIDFIGRVLMRDHNSSHIFSTHFMTQLLNDLSCVKSWHQKISRIVNFLYIPIHKDGNHWLLSRIDFKEKQILLWNSSPKNEDHSNYLDKLSEYIEYVQKQQVMPNKKKSSWRNSRWYGNWTVQDKSCNCPKQSNFDDCGIFTILNMVVLINDVDLKANSYSQELIDNVNTRDRISQIIHLSSDNLMTSQVIKSADRNIDDTFRESEVKHI